FLKFNVEPGLHTAEFSLDVSRPRSSKAARLVVKISSEQLLHRSADGVQLYRCEIGGPVQLAHFAAGKCKMETEIDPVLSLHHITNPTALTAIRTSKKLFASPWNLQGTRRLINVAYVYLTSLQEIRDEADLHRIAMACNGRIELRTTSARAAEAFLSLPVYRESTRGRTAALPLEVSYASGLSRLVGRPISGDAVRLSRPYERA
ncbi:MAG: hypothetical protein ABMA14_18620, partial [Hyphomonadaceae bacterium]